MPDPSGVPAREGSFLHGVSETCLDKGRPARSLIGTSNGEFTLTHEDADHVQTAVDYVNFLRSFGGAQMVLERRVHAHEKCWGTLDVGLYFAHRRHLDVIDFKFGKGVYVSAHGNTQTRIYGVGALALIGGANVDTVGLHIVQPRHSSSKPTEESLSAIDLAQWARDVLWPGIDAAEAPNAPFKPGEWCTFCPGRAHCRALANQNLAVAKAAFGAPVAAPPDPNTMSLDELRVAMDASDLLRKWLAAVEERVFRLAKGNGIPGWKIVNGQGNRAWVDTDAAVRAVEALGADPYKKSPVSPAEAARRVAKATDMTHAAAARYMSMWTQRPTTETLARDSDARPAVSIAQAFLEQPQK